MLERLRYGACLLLLVATSLSAFAEPPKVAPRLPAKVGKPLIFNVKPDGEKKLTYAPGYDAEKCPVVRLLTEDGEYATFMALPTEPGNFYVTFWTRGEKEAGYSQLVIEATAGDKDTKPPVVIKPPTDPAPVPVAALYFLVVGPDGPALPAVTKSLQLPEWATLAAKGHAYKYKTATEAGALGVRVPAGVTLPAVVILRNKADGKSEQLKAVPLPTSGAEVLALPDAVK